MNILVTSFEPFGKSPVNSSEKSVSILNDDISGVRIHKRSLPTVFGESGDLLEKYIDEIKPDVVICVGQNAGIGYIAIERKGVNLDDTSVSDNKGNKPHNSKIVESGQPEHFTTLPVDKILNDIMAAGIDARASSTAGTYVCNHVMYRLLHYLKKRHPECIGGFIHVPCIPEQVDMESGKPAMEAETISQALNITIEAIAICEKNK